MDVVRKRKRFTESEAAFYMLQLIDALKYMHGLRVIHRDLKLGNLFLDSDMEVKIGDFAWQRLFFDGERKQYVTAMLMRGVFGWLLCLFWLLCVIHVSCCSVSMLFTCRT